MGDLAIISTFYNPLDYTNRKENLLKFLEFMKECNLSDDLYFCEILYNNQKPFIKHKNVIYLAARDNLWHKERSLNILAATIPNHYTKIMWIDADIIWNNTNWVLETSKMLDHHNVVQPFKKCKYLLKDGAVNTVGYSNFCRFISQTSLDDRKKFFEGVISHMGIAMAYKRSFFNDIGLFDKFLIGGGDTIMNQSALLSDRAPFAFTIKDPLFRQELYNYCVKNWKWTDGKFGFSNDECFHLYHGRRETRKYIERFEIWSKINFNDTFIIGKSGLYEFKPSANPEIVEYFKRYFYDRDEDNNADALLIDTIYIAEQCDGKYIWWMPDKFNIKFKHVKHVKLHFTRNGNIYTSDHIDVLSGKPTRNDFTDAGKLIVSFTFDNPTENVVSFAGDYFIPNKIDSSTPDFRKLSCILEKVELQYDNKVNIEEYPIKDILTYTTDL